MQEKPIIFLSTKACYDREQKLVFGEEKNFAGPATFPRHEGSHCQGGQRGGVYTKQVNIIHFPQKILNPEYLQTMSMIFSEYPEYFQDASGRRVEALRVRDVVHVQPERPARGGADVRSSHFRCKEKRRRAGRWVARRFWGRLFSDYHDHQVIMIIMIRSSGGQAGVNP